MLDKLSKSYFPAFVLTIMILNLCCGINHNIKIIFNIVVAKTVIFLKYNTIIKLIRSRLKNQFHLQPTMSHITKQLHYQPAYKCP